jgi:hypothetical protein
MRFSALLVVALAVISGCAINSQVTRSSQKSFAAKSDSCNIEFFRTQRPAVAYDEIGAIHLAGSVMESAADAQEALRKQACALGADAVIITDEVYQVPNVGLRVTGTAVAYSQDQLKRGDLSIGGSVGNADADGGSL